MPLMYGSTKSLTSGIRLRCGLDKPMASVMAIESEVFGSCAREIDVSVEVENKVPSLAVGGITWDLS